MLEDFPLNDPNPNPNPAGAAGAASGARDEAPPSSEVSRPSPPAPGAAAPLSARFSAAAADAAAVLLLTALAILAARLRTGASPGPSGLLWIAAFVLYLSAFATIVPIVAFGRTIGMALADLSARPDDRNTGSPRRRRVPALARNPGDRGDGRPAALLDGAERRGADAGGPALRVRADR